MSPVEGVTALAARVAEIRQVVEGRALPRSSAAERASGFAAVLAAEVGAAGGVLGGSAAGLGPVLGTLTGSATGSVTAAGAAPSVAAVAPAAPAGPDLTPSSVRRINGDALPAALAVHQNGRVPEAALSPVGTGGHRLFAPAAQALTSLIDAAARDGVSIGITDTYRTYDTQVDLVRRKGLYSQGGLAATPGTSDHGWGLAADLRLDDRALAWMRTNAGRFGFAEDTPREPWHWAFQT